MRGYHQVPIISTSRTCWLSLLIRGNRTGVFTFRMCDGCYGIKSPKLWKAGIGNMCWCILMTSLSSSKEALRIISELCTKCIEIEEIQGTFEETEMSVCFEEDQ